jgi:hypothetical protein
MTDANLTNAIPSTSKTTPVNGSKRQQRPKASAAINSTINTTPPPTAMATDALATPCANDTYQTEAYLQAGANLRLNLLQHIGQQTQQDPQAFIDKDKRINPYAEMVMQDVLKHLNTHQQKLSPDKLNADATTKTGTDKTPPLTVAKPLPEIRFIQLPDISLEDV